MAVTVREREDSREFTQGRRATLIFNVKGTADQTEAVSGLISGTTSIFEGLARQTPTVRPINVNVNTPDNSLWEGVVLYTAFERPTPPVVGESFFSFDTQGGTQHITQSKKTLQKIGRAGETAPDNRGSIGASPNGPEGVDIVVPVYNFSERHYKAEADVTAAYKDIIFRMTGRVNDAPFKGLDTGECLFLGAQGSKRGEEDWEITYNFAGSPNDSSITGIGKISGVGGITGISKNGWQYLWVMYEEDTDQNFKIWVPKAAYVERVYDDGDFSTLDIGVDP